MFRSYGWSEALQTQFVSMAAPGQSPARVIVQQRGLYRLATETGECSAALAGRLMHECPTDEWPVTGDWVVASLRPEEHAATIHQVMPRRSAFVRRATGPGGGTQVVAANADLALIVTSLNGDLNLRRIERYLATAWSSGAEPIVLLTKSDLSADVADAIAGVEGVAFGVPVFALSAVTGEGMDGLRARLKPGQTAVLLGTSGVGKSTLVNALLGAEKLKTGAIRENDARGRHTTTHRELVLLPSGALLLDTPGMRELGLIDAEAGVSATFEDIEELARHCRFRDCRHEREPGCAVRAARDSGGLAHERWQSYLKLNRELAFLERKDDPAAQAAIRKVYIRRTKNYRAREKARGKWNE